MSEPARVLVADDDPDICRLVAYRLTKAGYEVETHPNGKEALAAARAHHPDLLLLDVMMPQLNGFEVLEAVRAEQDESLAGVPVILLTASVQDAHVSQAFDQGATDYMRKPFNPKELLSRVSKALGRG